MLTLNLESSKMHYGLGVGLGWAVGGTVPFGATIHVFMYFFSLILTKTLLIIYEI